MDPFLGQIIMFGGNFAPRGWALCQGQLLAISQNSALFSILGTTYGGDGRTTFALPDLRGRMPISEGTGPGLSTRKLGQRGGEERTTLNLLQIPSHFHTASANTQVQVSSEVQASSALATSATPIEGGSIAAVAANRGEKTQALMYNNSTPDVSLAPAVTAGTAATQVHVDNSGGSQSHNNMQPYLTVHYIIALQGIFPSRN